MGAYRHGGGGEIERALLVALGPVATGDEDHRIAGQGLTQAGTVQRRRLVSRQQQADRAGMPFDDGIGRQGGGKSDHGDVFARVTQHAFHCPLQADRQIVLGGQRFGSREHALRRVEENRVGIGAAGIEAEEKGQWSAGLVRNGATFTMPPRKLKPRDHEAWIDARTAPPNELTSTRSMACCEGELHIGPGR